jgi:exosortase A
MQATERILPTLSPVAVAQARQSGRPEFLLVAAILLLPALAYLDTVRSIVALWDSSETFAHGYIILPITLLLIWHRRDSLRQLPMAPCWPALGLLAVCGLGWLLAELGEVQFARQYAFAAMLPLSVLAVLGWTLARALAFPLVFVLFAVPFGEIFIAPLINITADFTVAMLQLTGIPVLREGNHFAIPSGNWSVVEACSGVRYLISSVTLGCLYAYLSYRSRVRQAVFIALSIVVPILANGLRAYMIVMIGHLSGMTLAVGVDHLIYGWIFFGIVMFLLFWVASHWREDRVGAPSRVIATIGKPRRAAPGQLAAAALAVLATVSAWPAYAWYLDRSQDNPAPAVIAGVDSNWTPAPAFASWTPAFTEPSARRQLNFARDGQQVGLTLLAYRNQHRGGSALISSVNRIVGEHDSWRELGRGAQVEALANGRKLQVRETRIDGPQGKLVVWHWYRIGNDHIASDYLGKFQQVRQRLFDGNDDGAAIMLHAPYSEKPEEARTVLRAFASEHLAAIDTALAAQGGRP